MFHAAELFGQKERLFLTEPCRSPIPTLARAVYYGQRGSHQRPRGILACIIGPAKLNVRDR